MTITRVPIHLRLRVFLAALCCISWPGHALAQAPATPQSLAASIQADADGNSVLISWDPVAGATGYTLSYGVEADSPIGEVFLGDVTELEVVIDYNLRFFIGVIAHNGDSRSSASTEIEVSTFVAAPAAPAALSAIMQGTSLTLNWGVANGAQAYHLYYGNVGDSAENLQGPFPLGDATSLDAGDIPVGNYLLAVSASNPGGESGLSNLLEINPTVASDIRCRADDVDNSKLFTASPMALEDVTEVIPLGNVAPASHVLAVDHMYIHHSDFGGDGSNSFPVFNMGAGDIYLIEHRVEDGIDDFDVYIKHSCNVSSYFFHLAELSEPIMAALANANWVEPFGDGSTRILFLGQPGDTPLYPLAAGEQVGASNSRLIGYDIGVIDRRRLNGHFENTAGFRYADFGDYVAQLSFGQGLDFDFYDLGNKSLNAACFIDYLTPDDDLQSLWRQKLASQNLSCGRNGWDVAGRLQGHWFNPAIDSLSEFLFDVEVAALAVVPYNIDPENQVRIGFGVAATAFQNPELALLDPSNWNPPIANVDQIRTGFNLAVNPAGGVNPDPATVSVGETVCYDLPTPQGSKNFILFHLEDEQSLRVYYDPSAYGSNQCANMASAGFPPVDSGWVRYIR